MRTLLISHSTQLQVTIQIIYPLIGYLFFQMGIIFFKRFFLLPNKNSSGNQFLNRNPFHFKENSFLKIITLSALHFVVIVLCFPSMPLSFSLCLSSSLALSLSLSVSITTSTYVTIIDTFSLKLKHIFTLYLHLSLLLLNVSFSHSYAFYLHIRVLQNFLSLPHGFFFSLSHSICLYFLGFSIILYLALFFLLDFLF